MNERHCIHFNFLPMGLRVLYTSTLVVLGVGYLFAMIHIFASHAGRDGNPSLSVNDLVIAYSGSKADTTLEASLKGPMSSMLPQDEKDKIIAWVRRGADEKEYSADGIEAITKARCASCHDGSNPHIPNLMGYDNLKKVIAMDTGMDIFTLVRVSHIHLFGITFIFFISGSIFCHCYFRRVWIKCIVIMIPFLAIIFDIGSWYLTKIYAPFAWVVMISGVFMGVAFAIQWFASIYQMWFYKVPQSISDNGGAVS